MNPEDWYFLVDENIGDRVLFPGADDQSDVLSFALEHDAIILTNDWTDFTAFESAEHNGVLVVFDNDASAWSIVEWTMNATEAFEDPDNCVGWYKLERFDTS